MKMTKILSCLSWLLLAVLAGVPLASGCLSVLMHLNISDAIFTVLITCGVFLFVTLLLIGIRALFRFLASKWHIKEHSQKLWEVVLICLLTGGFFIFQYLIIKQVGYTLQDTDCFALAYVEDRYTVPQGVFGIKACYIALLHGVLMLLGNSATWGLFLQIALLYLAGLFAFLGTRKLYGRLAGIAAALLVWYLPESYYYSRILNGGVLFLFAFFLVFDLVADMLSSKGLWQIGKALLAGVFSGILCMMHPSGILFVFLTFFLLFCRDLLTEQMKKLRTAILYVVSLLASYVALLGILTNWNLSAAMDLLTLQFVTPFVNVTGNALETLLSMVNDQLITNGILAVLIFSHLISIPTRDRKFGISLSLTSFIFLLACCYMTYDLSLEMVRYGLFILLGATGLSVLLSAHEEKIPEEDAVPGKVLKADGELPEAEDKDGEEEAKVPSVSQILEQHNATRTILPAKKDESALIKAPLPGPKKRVKKEVDYPRQIPEDLMHYDIEITDDDEFDVS